MLHVVLLSGLLLLVSGLGPVTEFLGHVQLQRKHRPTNQTLLMMLSVPSAAALSTQRGQGDRSRGVLMTMRRPRLGLCDSAAL
ncbi:hypothetical protein AB0K48_47365 [Nonomuraea sp. NPDC055795]